MASIIKRKNSYCVVYRYTDEKGKSHQRWESFPTNAEARKRKNQIEYEQDNNVFTVPEARTVRELLVDYMEIYGVNKWAMSTYDAKNSVFLFAKKVTGGSYSFVIFLQKVKIKH